MDLATLIGLLVGMGLVGAAIVNGGNALIFVNVPSLLIVVGGTIATLLMRFPMADAINGLKVVKAAFFAAPPSPMALIEQIVEMARLARKEGVLALESVEPEDPFMRQAIAQVVDGVDAGQIKRKLETELEQIQSRHDTNIGLYKMGGDVAPAFGMIGTLIGLVQMLSAMEDPSSIGPAMAVALLTTLYGAMIANLLCLPIADKLAFRSEEELFTKRLILEGVVAIGRGDTNPNAIRNMLVANLPASGRGDDE